MVETVIINPKDRVLIYRDKEGKYEIREVTIHGENIYDLLPKANEILSKLREGKFPTVDEEKVRKRFVCVECGYSFPAFPEDTTVMRTWCHQCNKRQNFEKK